MGRPASHIIVWIKTKRPKPHGLGSRRLVRPLYKLVVCFERQLRLERNLTQEELGRLVGVQKAQISKLENSLTDARFETIIKVFKALNAKINFNVELLNQTIKLA